MAFWLAQHREGQDSDWIQRFDPRFWTVDFPRPMMASVITTAPDGLRVDATFLRTGDAAVLAWDSADTLDHPLLVYRTDRDYARTTLSFRWRSGGLMSLDAASGAVLTITGRDAAGAARSWSVRLWSHAVGTPADARITLPFSQLWAGADPVYPADIDRLAITLAPPGYVAGSTTPLAAAVDGWVELSEIRCDGHRALLEIGDVVVPPHGLSAVTDYDESFAQTPARLVRGLRGLGYRGAVLHAAGMSRYMRLVTSSTSFIAPTNGDALCGPARAWHNAFYAECAAAGLAPITALSFELLAQSCRQAWQQRAWNNDPALTSDLLPATLLTPANSQAMAWLGAVAAAFAGMMDDAGVAVRVTLARPRWQIMPDGRPCIYDSAAKALYSQTEINIADMRQPLTAAQTAQLDSAGSLLASAAAALVQAVRAAAAPGSAEVLLLADLAETLDPAMPEARRMNLPASWAAPAFDRLQITDPAWLTAGADGLRRAGYGAANQRLGYPALQQDYVAGTADNPATAAAAWRRIDAGIDEARARLAHGVFVRTATPICRDGYVRIPASEETSDMQPFDDIPYPLALGLDATVISEFSTSVAVTASGFERRNSLWSDARLRFDVGPGVRSEAEMGVLIAFFRARRGPARGFRLRDPSDCSSNGMTGVPTAQDQLIGTGDGVTSSFALCKRYGDGPDAQERRITRPVSGSVLVSVGGTAMATGWTLEPGGIVMFTTAPAAGALVRAGFRFDVPVRFAEDRLEIAGSSFAAGEAPSVPVVEIREALAA